MNRLLHRHPELVVLALTGLGLTIYLFRPVLADMDGRVVGQEYSEQYVSGYVNQVFIEDVVKHHRPPLLARDVVYDEGVVSPLSLATVLLSLPAYPFFNVNGVYNVAMVLNFLLTLFGAFFLFRHIAKDRWSAFPGALLYALSPYCLDNFVYGPVECTAMGWIPLALLSVERLSGRPLHLLVTGITLALVFAASPYYSLFTVMAAVYLMMTRAGAGVPARLKRTALTLAVAGVLTAPWFHAISHTLRDPRSLTPTRTQPRDMTFHREWLSSLVVLDLGSLAAPTRRFQTVYRDHGVYLGLTGLLACGFALVWARRSRRWLWLGLGALLFALGGSIKIGGWIVGAGGYTLAAPAWWLCMYVPPFTQVYTPFRAIPLVYLAMGAMITLLLSRGGINARRGQIALISLALAADVVLGFRGAGSLPSARYEVPAFYEEIGRDQERYGVVDLPAPRTDNELGRYLLFQQVHRKRVPYNLDMDALGTASTPEAQGMVLGSELDPHIPNKPRDWAMDDRLFRCHASREGALALLGMGYRYMVLHRTGRRDLDDKLVRCLERVLPKVRHKDEQTRVYDLRHAAAGPGLSPINNPAREKRE